MFERSERGIAMFQRDIPMPNAIAYYYAHDNCALVTAKENQQAGTAHWSKLLPVEWSWFSVGTKSLIRKRGEGFQQFLQLITQN
jgi:hypothetical protein